MFDNVICPQIACRGVTKQEIFPVTTIGNNKHEYRNTSYSTPLFEWNISSVGMDNETKEILKSFLRQRKYGLRSFKFVDPDKPLLDERLGYHDTTRWKMNLSELNSSGNKIPGDHPIFHLGTVQVRRNGNVVAHTFVIDNGTPLINVPGSVSTDIITITGEYYFAVALKTTFAWTIKTLSNDGGPHAVTTTDIIFKEVNEF